MFIHVEFTSTCAVAGEVRRHLLPECVLDDERRLLAVVDATVVGLNATGPETDRSLANKISRGRFRAGFFTQCLSAIGARTLRLEEP
jgi:hypothetical protein